MVTSMKPKKTEKLKTVFKTYQFWLKIQYTLSHKSFIGRFYYSDKNTSLTASK
jgi:hypothetical protein